MGSVPKPVTFCRNFDLRGIRFLEGLFDYDKLSVEKPLVSVDNGSFMGITPPNRYLVARHLGAEACLRPNF